MQAKESFDAGDLNASSSCDMAELSSTSNKEQADPEDRLLALWFSLYLGPFSSDILEEITVIEEKHYQLITRFITDIKKGKNVIMMSLFVVYVRKCFVNKEEKSCFFQIYILLPDL